MDIKCSWDGQNILGESPLWDHRNNLLYWVDIDQRTLHQLEPSTGDHQSWTFLKKPCCLGLREQGGLISAFSKGFALIELPSGNLTLLEQPLIQHDDVMFNDGKCDRQGCFWAGSKDIDEISPTGKLFRLDPQGNIQTISSGFIVSNGLGWNLDNTIMYFTDSPSRKIYRYDFDSKHGTISAQRIFAKISQDAGFPDGLTVDSEGYIWSAHWDGWRVTRYAPDGTVDRTLQMPVSQPTSCCFGGPELKTLFITSAKRGLTEDQVKQQPQAGGLFAIETDVQGCAEPLYKG